MQVLYPDSTWDERAMACPDRLSEGRTYGEFTEFPEGLDFFHTIVERCRELHAAIGPATGDPCFLDLGSGSGRAVLSASYLWKWRHCRGIEISPTLHAMALEASAADNENLPYKGGALESTPRGFTCASFLDQNHAGLIRESQVVFTYSTAFPTDQDGTLSWLVEPLQALQEGAIIATVDHPLFLPCGDEGSCGFIPQGEIFGPRAYGEEGLDACAYIYQRAIYRHERRVSS